jgi:outer membrane receptor protein involved in Fe transport
LPLSGRVVDAATGDPLEYATISAYSLTDSSLIDGSVSGVDGRFTLNLPPAEYRLLIEFIGFAQREMQVSHPADGDLGIIELSADGVNLDAVEVRAEKSSMNLQLDKKVFNVGEDALSQGGSANQVLAQVPAVAVSAEGAVSLRGNASVKILINGRPSALADNNGLDGIPAASIESIEVITNPSARYEAAGTAGIINIILKKEQERGYGGSLTLGTGYPADHQALLNLNYRHEKFRAFANLNGRYANFRGDGDLTRSSLIGGETVNLLRIPDMDRNDKAWSSYAGLDYFPDDRTTLTASYSIYDVINDDFTRNDYFYTDGSDSTLRDLRQGEDYLEPGTYQQVDLIYDRELTGGKLNVQFNHDAWRETENQAVSINELAPDPATVVSYRTVTEESSRDFRLQADYTHSVGEHGKLETGLRLETRIISSDYIAENEENGNFTVIPGFENVFDYYERIGSAYLQYAYQRDALGIQFGLRNEYTAIRAENEVEVDSDFRKYYNQLFPSASVKFDFTETVATQLAYSRRIRRPQFWQLNPFGGLRLPTSIFFGNPDIDPAYTDRLELNLVANWDKVTFNPAVYASTTSGYFQMLIEQEADNLFGLNDGTIISRPINLQREYSYGFQLTTSYRPVEALSLAGDVHIRGYQQRGRIDDRNYDFDFATWSANLRTQLQVGKGGSLQARINYNARSEDVQSINFGVWTGELGVSQRIAQQFTVSARVRSPQYFRSQTFRPTFRQEDYFQWTGWRYGLTVAYKFERGADSEGRRVRGSIR